VINLTRPFLKLKPLILISFVGIFIGMFLLWNGYTSAIKNYEFSEEVVIPEGSTTLDVLEIVQEQEVNFDFYEVRLWQTIFSYQIKAGTHVFDSSVTMIDFLSLIDSGNNLVQGAKLVIPEGFSNQKIINRLEELSNNAQLGPDFDLIEFSELIADSEGRLFPDTYYINSDTTAESLYQLMVENFESKTSDFEPALTEEEVIIASIVEREVSDPIDRHFVAGILFKWWELGMRLQVDASLNYYLDKTSAELTVSDLQADNPYNTYTRDGLPPRPISNPGLSALDAARNPEPSDYLFYLSAPDGTTYFASDLEGHIENRNNYLDS